MAKKSTTDTCCLTLPLKLEKWQMDRLEKRFEIARQIYNTLLRHELKKLCPLEEMDECKAIREAISSKTSSDDTEKPYKQLFKFFSDHGISEYGFKADVKLNKKDKPSENGKPKKKCRNIFEHFGNNIGSDVTRHGIAPDAWRAIKSKIFRPSRTVHFKKKGEMNSVRGANSKNGNGGGEITFRVENDKPIVKWKELKLPVKIDEKNEYEQEMLQKRVKYCRLIRKPGKHKTHWYVQLSLEGKPAVKYDRQTHAPKHPVGQGVVGIDIGPQTIAYVSEQEVDLRELADKTNSIERERRILQRKLDRSRRATNPDNYAEDGTIRRGVKLTHNKSKRYLRNERKLAALYHQQAESRKRQHIELANHLLSLGDTFIVEDMNWESLARRAKNTEISEKTGKFKRKKRFGKSLGNKAPATLLSILKQKLESRGTGAYIKVDPAQLKASQYNHLTGECQKKPLSQRWNDMPDGRRIQRDMYSAFLLQHTNAEQNGYDDEGLNRDYEAFVERHDSVIEKLRNEPHTIASMGIVRTPSGH